MRRKKRNRAAIVPNFCHAKFVRNVRMYCGWCLDSPATDSMNGKQHCIAGLAVGAALDAVAQWLDHIEDPTRRFDWGEFFICALAGGAAGILPDILEPPDGPDHRQFFHSITAAAAVAYAVSGRHANHVSASARKLLSAIGFGYLSHIALDCTTPAGVGLI